MKETITEALGQMRLSLEIENSDLFVEGCNTITQKLGGTNQFSDRKSFDRLMKSDEEIEF